MGCTLNRLCERITVQSRSLRPDGCGGYKERWKTTGEFWAAVRVLSTSTERALSRSHRGYRLGGLEDVSQLFLITVRRDVEVKEGMRILWGKTYLTTVSPPEQKPESLYKTILASSWSQREREGCHV